MYEYTYCLKLNENERLVPKKVLTEFEIETREDDNFLYVTSQKIQLLDGLVYRYSKGSHIIRKNILTGEIFTFLSDDFLHITTKLIENMENAFIEEKVELWMDYVSKIADYPELVCCGEWRALYFIIIEKQNQFRKKSYLFPDNFFEEYDAKLTLDRFYTKPLIPSN